MKFILTYLFSILSTLVFCQIEVQVDSVVLNFSELFCAEDQNKMYDWRILPDSVEILMFNRYGDLLIKSEDSTIAFNSFIGNKIINYKKIDGTQLPEGTYFIIVYFELNKVKKLFKHFIYYTKYCGCG